MYDVFPFEDSLFQVYTQQTHHVSIPHEHIVTYLFSMFPIYSIQDEILLEDETNEGEILTFNNESGSKKIPSLMIGQI